MIGMGTAAGSDLPVPLRLRLSGRKGSGVSGGGHQPEAANRGSWLRVGGRPRGAQEPPARLGHNGTV